MINADLSVDEQVNTRVQLMKVIHTHLMPDMTQYSAIDQGKTFLIYDLY